MSINLALVDAHTNCSRDGAKANLTLRSGIVHSGKLGKSLGDSVILETETGWVTVLVEEIASVEVYK